LPTAEHILCVRWFGAYLHHGVYVGGDTVVHYTGTPGNKTDAAVKSTPLDEFSEGGTIHRVVHSDGLPARETIRRARSRVGEQKYDLVSNNCEHFARWCKTGEHRSEQTDGIPLVGSGTAQGIPPGRLAQIAHVARRLPPLAQPGAVAMATPVLLAVIGAAAMSAVALRHVWLMRHTEPFTV
jgi:hypothetical protein